MNKFISTAIYYSNSKLHIGSAYEVIYADSIARYTRMKGVNTFFMTGMDEHGQKIQMSAEKLNIKPKQHVDNLAKDAKTLFEHLNISYNHFIRTTDESHMKTVQAIFQKLVDSGDIYLSSYEGNYCVSCESFYTESQLNDGNCPDCGSKTSKVSEESYFLNLKKYEERLVKHINDNPKFIIPSTRRNEVLSFLSGGLEDLSVTRTSFNWGIPTLNDPKHVVYVWIDALSNYISALGYADGEKFDEFWNNGEVVHIIGKDILRFHAIYWPIVLMALGEKLPDSIITHGFIMMGDDKMSKSKGNVVYPMDYTEHYGVDPLRYYLLSELANGNDGSFTLESFINRYNFDLVNDMSNLVNRTASMCVKYFDTNITYKTGIENEFEVLLNEKFEETKKEFFNAMEEYDTKKALQVIWSFVSRTNKFIDETTPWILVKEDSEKLMNVLYTLVESIRNISIFVAPFIPDTSSKIFEQFNLDLNQNFEALKFDNTLEFAVNKPAIIFNRLNVEEEILKMNPVDELKKPEITIDDFDKVELRVAKITDCFYHPNADKLLIFKLLVGDEERQIVSGIAKWYKPDTLIGKNVVIVANLKPVKLRGEISQGMILSAEKDDVLNVVESINESGSEVR